MKISKSSSIENMLNVFRNRLDELEVSSSTKTLSELNDVHEITAHTYVDEHGGAFGEPGLAYSEEELRSYYEQNEDSDPVLQGYASFEDWLTDTIDHGGLTVEVDGGCSAEQVTDVDENLEDVYAVDTLEDDFVDYYDDSSDIEESVWAYVDSKQVQDSDGFWTDYTLYHNIETDEYATVFGDADMYKPEDGYFDAEFDNRDEAIEWFESYEGFADDDEYSDTYASTEPEIADVESDQEEF